MVARALGVPPEGQAVRQLHAMLAAILQVQGETGPRTRSWASEVGAQGRKGMLQMARSVWKTDGLQGFLSGVSASVREAISSD